jgi:hypothetical protein
LKKGTDELPGEVGSQNALPVPGKITANITEAVGDLVLREPERRTDPALTGIDDTVGDQKDPAFIIEDITKKDGGSDLLQIYLLPILIALSVIIMVLLVFMAFQKKTSAGLPRSVKRSDFLKANDETIAAINAKIDQKIKKIK